MSEGSVKRPVVLTTGGCVVFCDKKNFAIVFKLL